MAFKRSAVRLRLAPPNFTEVSLPARSANKNVILRGSRAVARDPLRITLSCFDHCPFILPFTGSFTFGIFSISTLRNWPPTFSTRRM